MKPNLKKITEQLDEAAISNQNVKEAIVYLNYRKIGKVMDILKIECEQRGADQRIKDAYEKLLKYSRYEPSGIIEKLRALFSRDSYD